MGEFISADEGAELLDIAKKEAFTFSEVENLGKVSFDDTTIDSHIAKVLALPLVDCEAIKKANFKVAIDCVNSTGGIVLPKLLKELGVENIEELYCTPDGHFPHNPEPLPENLTEISKIGC